MEEPRRRGDSVDEEGGGEVLVEETGLVLDLVDDPVPPLENLHEQLLHRRRRSLFRHELDNRRSEFRERERERDASDAGSCSRRFLCGRRRWILERWR